MGKPGKGPLGNPRGGLGVPFPLLEWFPEAKGVVCTNCFWEQKGQLWEGHMSMRPLGTGRTVGQSRTRQTGSLADAFSRGSASLPDDHRFPSTCFSYCIPGPSAFFFFWRGGDVWDSYEKLRALRVKLRLCPLREK